jgi:hypothetical protein
VKKANKKGAFLPVIGRKPWLAPDDARQPINLAVDCLEALGKSHLAFSANLIVDLHGTALSQTSIQAAQGGLGILSGQIGIASGIIYPGSGGIVGQGLNYNNANTFCNLLVTGVPIPSSGASTVPFGQLRVAVQCASQDVSGSYTDPTSGLAQFPAPFQSGGYIWLNSGGLGIGSGAGLFDNAASGQYLQSGFQVFAGFQRTGQFVRAVVLSGDPYVGTFAAGFVSQLRTPGSGGGASQSPQQVGSGNYFFVQV